MREDKITLKEKLLFVRTEMQLTQAELAAKTGISVVTIARWETTNCVPQPKLYGKLLSYCRKNNIFLM